MDTLPDEIARFAAARPRAWVWALPLTRWAERALPALEASLDAEERIRVSAFHFEKDALAYAAAHALLRWSLSVRYGQAQQAWRFASGAWGKPSVANPATGHDIRFSLSHTDGLVAVALCEGFDIGVDAEAMKPRGDLSEVARECFSDAEQAQWAQEDGRFAPGAERFYAFWTLKEALLKAKGLGLSQAPNSFSVDLDSMQVQAPQAVAPVHAWQLHWRRATPHHLVAAALDAPSEVRDVAFSVIDEGESWLGALRRY